jgi:hypothetical protein
MTTKAQALKIGHLVWTALTGSREEIEHLAADAYEDVQQQVRAGATRPSRPLNGPPPARQPPAVIDAEFEDIDK